MNLWGTDFEFGDGPVPRCCVARDLARGTLIRVWEDELLTLAAAPFPIGPDDVLVAYAAAAEISCFLALGWPLPAHCLDLYVEFKRLTNGRPKPPPSYGLLSALDFFGLPHLDADEKEAMQGLALRGGPWAPDEPAALLDYCQSDVDALVRLYPPMATALGWPALAVTP